MIKIKSENYDYIIDGYISNINISKSNKNNMITLVNGRVVTNQSVNRTIKDAYHGALADNKYPIVVLNIETDPTLIDVNIHPTKQDIKFSKLESLTDLLFSTIKEALNNSNNVYKAYKETSYTIEPKQTIIDDSEYDINPLLNIVEERQIEEIRLDLDTEEKEVKYDEDINERENKLIEPVGLALGTYLIAQDENTMYMFDIHASAERINYEKVTEYLKSNKVYKTNMLFPITLECTTNEFMNIKNNINVITDMGFEVDEFGKNTFRVLAHPSWLKEGYEEESIKHIFELVGELQGKFDKSKFNDSVAATLACKMSVKANTCITYEEQKRLINDLYKCKFPFTCPHGRPTHMIYPIYELEKMFKRVNFSKENKDE